MLRWVALLALASGCRQVLGLDNLPPADARRDAPPVQPDGLVVAGSHDHYVINKIFVPTNNTQARDDGLDINGDATVDNQLGMVFGTLGSQGLDLQTAVDTGVATGQTILLADLQTVSFAETLASSFSLFGGDNPSPPACSGADDTTCGHHLAGSGMFGISPEQPTNAPLVGPIVGGTLATTSDGDLSFQLFLGGGAPLTLNLIGARVRATGMSATGIMSAILAGAIAETELMQHVLPQLHDGLVTPTITQDCPGATAADTPGCKCIDGSTGKQLIALLDTMPADCSISLTEIENNNLFSNLLAPDVTIHGVPALSVGVKVTAVPATFTAP